MSKVMDLLKEHKCRECGSNNFNYLHEYDSMELKSMIKITCKDCGHIEYL